MDKSYCCPSFLPGENFKAIIQEEVTKWASALSESSGDEGGSSGRLRQLEFSLHSAGEDRVAQRGDYGAEGQSQELTQGSEQFLFPPIRVE